MRLISRKIDTLSTYLASWLVGRLFSGSQGHGPVKVMVFKLDNAGDVVLSSLVMPRVAEALGNASVVYVVKKGLGGLLRHVACVSDVVEVPSGLGHCSGAGEDRRGDIGEARKMVRKAVQEHRPGIIMDFRPTSLGNYGALVGVLNGAKLRVSLERERLREVFGLDNGMKWKRHEVETFCLALQDAGLLASGADYRSGLTFWDVKPEDRTIGKYFLLQPGAVWEFKKWPERHYASLIDALSEDYPGHSFILVGSQAEATASARVREMTGKKTRDKVLDLAGKTDIEELISLVASADMVVANDSGVAHIAGAAGTRTIVFFGPSSPERFTPLSERQDRVKVFHRKLPCNPCDQHVCAEGPSSYCLARIDPREVAAYILTVLPREDSDTYGPARALGHF